MNYTLKYIENNIDTRFFNLYDPIQVLKLQKQIKGIHNQNRIVLDFSTSEIYKNNNCFDEYFEHFKTLKEEEKRPFQLEVFKEIKDKFIELDSRLLLKQPDELTFQDFEEYIKLLARDLDVMYAAYTHEYRKFKIVYCRFGCNRLSNGLNKEAVNYVLDNTIKIESLLQKNYDFSEKLDLNWHTFLTTCWTLIEGGLAEVSLDIIETVLELFNIEIQQDRSAAQNTFVALYISGNDRGKFTALWIKALALIQLNKEEQAKEVLQYMIDFLSKSRFRSYVIHNRMTEASILLYLLKPSKKHSDQAKRLIISNAKEKLVEPTETVTERGLIIYDFCKHILKQNI